MKSSYSFKALNKQLTLKTNCVYTFIVLVLALYSNFTGIVLYKLHSYLFKIMYLLFLIIFKHILLNYCLCMPVVCT